MQIYSVKVDWCKAQDNDESLIFSMKAKVQNDYLADITIEYNYHYASDETRMKQLITRMVFEVLQTTVQYGFEDTKIIEDEVKNKAVYHYMTLRAFNKKYAD